MAIETAVITGTTPTSTGTKSFEKTSFGTPQAAIIIASRGNTTNNPSVTAGIGIGFTDGTNDCAAAVAAQDAQGSSSTGRYSSSARCVLIGTASSTSAEAAFSAWATDGITLNFTKVSTVAFYLTIILIKGATNVKAFTEQLTTTGVNDITSIGFKPNVCFFTTIGSSSVTTTAASQAILGFGAAHNNSSDVVTQGYTAFSSVTAQPSEVADVITRSDSCIGQLFNGTQGWKGSAQDFDASGISINTGADSPGNDYIFGLAADTGDTDGISIDIVDSPTSTGTWDVTAPGHEPQSVILGMTTGSTTNTINSADPMAFGISAFDDTNEGCSAIDVDDAAGTTDTQSNFSSANGVQLYTGAGGHSLLMEGSFSSFDSSGYNYSFPTTVDSTARKFLSISIEVPATGVTGKSNPFNGPFGGPFSGPFS